MDISPETVGTLSLIMLAQAQEVFFLKATSGTQIRHTHACYTHTLHVCVHKSSNHGIVCPTDKMKDAIIAKLANQAADFYSDAFKQCQYKENLPKVCVSECV